MLWPTPADYAQAVGGYPDVCLLDPKLKGGKPKKTPTNQLLVYTGGFSTVFPIEVVNNKHALRCWNQDIGNSKNRYEKIDDYLKQVQLPYFVDFEYVPEGILINGKKWPITRMEWAIGESLRDFIEHNLHDPKIFGVVADEFRKMFETLHANQISHGDLQSGNIMLRKNGTDIIIKLIDYDSLFVPALRGQKSPTPGLPEYQHPSRSDKCDEKMDYFSELVIYLSFLSLSEKPELWDQFKDKTEKGLLFSKEDFKNSDQSDIFKELENLSSDVQNLASTLKEFCAKTSIDDLDPLEVILPKHDAKYYTDQGQNHIDKSRYNDAISEFQKAIALNPNYEKALYGLGLSYLHCNRYNEAINACEQAIYIEPNYKEAYLVLGFAHLKSGHNSKATIAAHEALKIDPLYQPAKQLLDAIKDPPVPPDPPDPPNPPDPSPNYWQSLVSVLRTHWQFITPGILGVGLIICLIAFLTQMNAKDNALAQSTGLKNQLAQKENTIQGLNSSIQTLESDNESLNTENQTLQEELESKTISDSQTSKNVVSLQRQLNEQKDINRKLEEQLTLKNAENRKLRNEKVVALSENKKLRNEKAVALSENRKPRSQLPEKVPETKNQSNLIQQLRNEKLEMFRENQKLQGKNKELVIQNQKLQNENKTLLNQLGKVKEENSNQSKESPDYLGNDQFRAALPKKVLTRNNISPRARILSKYSKRAEKNNQGFNAFNSKQYSRAITYFKEAAKIDSKFATAHYNLGCTYLQMKEYRNAINAFNKAVGSDLNFKEAYYNRSLAYYRLNSLQAAKLAVRKALSIDATYQPARKLLTAIEKAQQ